jgi:hypothetical protein
VPDAPVPRRPRGRARPDDRRPPRRGRRPGRLRPRRLPPAAGDLETAARLHEEIAAEAERVANEHLAIATSATGQASAAQKQADKIRELIA